MEVRKIKHKLDSKGTKDKIIELFFEKHLKPIDIAKKLDVKMPYITKIIQKDSRYIQEKEARKQKKKKKERQEKQDYQKLLTIINNDNRFLSTKKKVSDIKYAKWNRSAYNYDEDTSDLVLKDNINAGYNVAKRVSDIVNPDMIKSNKIYV